MDQFAALTLQLRPAETEHWLGMHLRLPAHQVDARLLPDASVRVSLPWAELRAAANDPAAYGHLLSAALFTDQRARTALAIARAQADTAGLPLHTGIDISGATAEVHGLRWELLQDPEPGQVAWALNERLPLARTPVGDALLPVAPRPGPASSVLVAVASPADLPDYGFLPLDIIGEVARARQALAPLRPIVVARAEGVPCTLTRLLDGLRDGPDMLLLVAHGRYVEGEVYLWLEDEQGRSARVAGGEFVARLTALLPATRPALVMFATCESGGSDGVGMPAHALGPLLASRGIPAVIAVHGLLSLDTNAIFLPVLLREVLEDGMIDRAVAAARGAVSDRPDWWSPVLWLRLPHGRLWAPRSAVGERQMQARPQLGERLVGSSGALDLPRGLAALRTCLETSAPSELGALLTFEARLEQSRRSERLFGSTETLRSEQAQIIYALNEIALVHCGVAFNDLCRAAAPA